MTQEVTRPPDVPLVCAGTPHEMGVTQGAALANEIRGAHAALRDIEAFCLLRPWWMPFSWFCRLAGSKARRSTSAAVAARAPALHERVLGIAQGANVPDEQLWLLHAMEALIGSAEGTTDAPPPAGCSAAAIRGRASASGRPIIAHNFDYLPAVQPFFAVRESRPRGGFRSIEFTAAPLSGAVDGVNERGLAVTYNYAETTEKGDPGPTISMRVSEVLAAAATVEEALAAVTSRPRWGSGLLMLADAGGAVASVELANTRTAVRTPPGDGDVLYHANKFLCPATIAVEVPEDAVYNRRAPRALRGDRVHESSLRRMDRLAALLNGASALAPDDLARLMADHAEGEPSDATVCMHSDYWVTSACVQCLPAERALRVSFGTACTASYRHYAL